MALLSTQGPVLSAIEVHTPDQSTADPLAMVNRFDADHHHLVWGPDTPLQVQTPNLSMLVSQPFGLWIPAQHHYDVACASPWWVARFDAATCPASWERLTQIALGDVVGPMLMHVHRFPERAWAGSLASAVVEHIHEAMTTNPVPIRFPTDPRARQVADALAADPSNPTELVGWAPIVGASERTLRRLFVDQTGTPFRRWRLRLRAQTATRLLQEGVAVGEVALRCGYRSPDSLARAFRAEFGVAPTELAGLRVEGQSKPEQWPLAQQVCPRLTGSIENTHLVPVTQSITGEDMFSSSTRRAALLLAAALFVAACSSDEDTATTSSSDSGTGSDAAGESTSASEPTESASASASEPAEDAVATQIFVDDLGREVEIPAVPQRAFFYGTEHAAHLTTLGVVPAGVGESYTGDAIAELEGLGGNTAELDSMTALNWAEPNLEAIADLNPDMIVWWSRVEDEQLDRLSQIAPTIAIDPRANGTSFISDNEGERWSKQETLAEIFGVSDAFEEQQSEYNELVEDIRARHGDLLGSLEWTLFDTFDDGQAYMYNTPTYAYNAALPDIGLTPSAAHEQATADGVGYDEAKGYAVISQEQVPNYGADLVFVGRSTQDPIAGQLATVLDATEAGASDQVYPVDVARWTFHLLQAEINVLTDVDGFLSAGDVEDVGDFG
ncbi:MAG: helix-turn-helix domain-containing protein [Actinomycetota bacterium]